mmetsp:Transcript_12153/g.28471  ORF Transcript_12153/g.28471 Transcript_12153/m.28471 type:complete len:256 (+) Transcript_12153:89-856(+)
MEAIRFARTTEVRHALKAAKMFLWEARVKHRTRNSLFSTSFSTSASVRYSVRVASAGSDVSPSSLPGVGGGCAALPSAGPGGGDGRPADAEAAPATEAASRSPLACIGSPPAALPAAPLPGSFKPRSFVFILSRRPRGLSPEAKAASLASLTFLSRSAFSSGLSFRRPSSAYTAENIILIGPGGVFFLMLVSIPAPITIAKIPMVTQPPTSHAPMVPAARESKLILPPPIQPLKGPMKTKPPMRPNDAADTGSCA